MEVPWDCSRVGDAMPRDSDLVDRLVKTPEIVSWRTIPVVDMMSAEKIWVTLGGSSYEDQIIDYCGPEAF